MKTCQNKKCVFFDDSCHINCNLFKKVEDVPTVCIKDQPDESKKKPLKINDIISKIPAPQLKKNCSTELQRIEVTLMYLDGEKAFNIAHKTRRSRTAICATVRQTIDRYTCIKIRLDHLLKSDYVQECKEKLEQKYEELGGKNGNV